MAHVIPISSLYRISPYSLLRSSKVILQFDLPQDCTLLMPPRWVGLKLTPETDNVDP